MRIYNIHGEYMGEFDISPNADLREANLSEADLSDADLRDANLREANLSEARLYKANLRGANLSWVNLRGADLHSADLRDADLRGSDLRLTSLEGADLRGAYLYHTPLYDKTRELRRALRECLQKNGGLILYRTAHSTHVGGTEYKPGRSYTAPVLSSCPVTDCHPGIYGLPLSDFLREYPDEEAVKIYVPYGMWHFVSGSKGFRARRIRVLGKMAR